MITFSQLGHYGRLGNQLFQIASTLGIAHLNGVEAVFPKWKYEQYFHGKLNHDIPMRLWQYSEMDSYHHEIYLDKAVDWDLVGYFQSWKYFEAIKPQILELFSFDRIPVDRVAIHVRRGDYLSFQHVHPVLPMEYYKKALKRFPFGTKFTVFSDDKNWCVNNFLGYDFDFSIGRDDIEDLQYMASHKGVIMANSSYSWWAGYLCGGQVIAPSLYVIGETRDDRIHPEWVKI